MSRSLFRATLVLLAILVVYGLKAQPSGCHLHSQDPDYRAQEPDPVTLALLKSSTARSDSIDILHYEIRLDVTDFGGTLKGVTTIRLTPKLDGIDTVTFDLAKLKVDSVLLGGQPLDFQHDDPFLRIATPGPIGTGDTLEITVHYSGSPIKDPVWGGFYFEGGYAYNLGIGLSSNPPNFGRAWYPCFDNFVERATYDIHVLSSAGRKGYAVGDLVSETMAGQDSIWRHYRMEQLLPTYLTNVAVSNYAVHRDTHQGAFGAVPIELLSKPSLLGDMKSAFSRMGDAIDAIENWYGPYPWSRVGYVLTTVGAMEHPTNVAFPENALNNGQGDVRLLTHELGHHWWGNITTLREPTDMWIKEGNAEYCAHLIDEWSEGREAFINTVKSNHLTVLNIAHQQDGDFLPLSGLPFANIYGRHTYLKGASMLHNMRGYLGDSLFRFGQQAILKDYAYSAISAETYRDHLGMVTGKDMGPYFDNWIFQPGYASFKVQDVKVEQQPNGYKVTVTLKQGLRAAPAYHQEVPLEISLYRADWGVDRQTVIASGEYSVHEIFTPFEPVHIALNERNLINQARMDYQKVLKTVSNNIYPFVRFRVNVQTVQDSALVRVDHHWTAPDPLQDQPQLQISSTNFWVVSGIFPSGFKAQGRLTYESNAASAFLDADLTAAGEDSLLLLYRPSPQDPWKPHPSHSVLKFSPTDGKGEVVINDLKPGEYAMARGLYVETSSTSDLSAATPRVFPNPVQGQLFLDWPEGLAPPTRILWYDLHGKPVEGESLSPRSGIHALTPPDTGTGFLILQVEDGAGHLHPFKVSILR